MAEYINTKTFLTDIMNRYCMKCEDDNGTRCLACWVADMQDEIVEAPAADVVEVVRGRWIVKKNYHHGHYIDTECFCSECNTVGSPQWKGCPVCLARMDGE